MTWGDTTSASTPSWGEMASDDVTWGVFSESYASGNFSRFIDADPIADGSGGVDFNNTFSSENPWVFTTRAPIAFTATNRNDPT